MPRLLRPPGFIEPCQPTAAAKPPAGPGWLHEIKHDGYRLQAWRNGERVRLFTRGGHDWSERYPLIAQAVGALKVRSCLIDGEAVACGDDGVPVFELMRGGRRGVHLIAFDLLELDGADLRTEPIEARKRALARLLRRPRAGLVLNEVFEGTGDIVFAHACTVGLEGIVSKKLGSRYRSGRCDDWRKVKNPGAPAVRRELEEDWNSVRSRSGK